MNYFKFKNLNIDFNLKDRKILLLTSKFHKTKPYIKKLYNFLSKKNTIFLFSKIKSGAPITDLDYILDQYNRPNIIIGIGGGSVIDIAKAASCLFFLKKNERYIKSDYKKKINTIVIPTIYGSGAETSYGSILKKKDNTKIALRDKMLRANKILYNLDLSKSANTQIQSESLYDCLAHAVESYISKKSSPTIEKRSIEVITKILKFKNTKIFRENNNIKTIAYCSEKMGRNLADGSTCLPHRIQYSISKYTKSSHAACIIALHKGWLQNLIDNKNKKFLKLVHKLYLRKVNFIKEIDTFKKNFQINYSLKNIRIKKYEFNKIIKNTNGKLNLDPSFYGNSSIRSVLNKSL